MTMMKERTWGYNRKTGEARIFDEGEIMGADWATKPLPGMHNHDKEAGVKFEPEAEKASLDPDGKPGTGGTPDEGRQTGNPREKSKA